MLPQVSNAQEIKNVVACLLHCMESSNKNYKSFQLQYLVGLEMICYCQVCCEIVKHLSIVPTKSTLFIF